MPTTSTIIVATDGREQSDGALRAGAMFAKPGDAWRILSVIAPLPVVSMDLEFHVGAEVIDASREGRARMVQEQVRRVLGDDARIQIDVHMGHPAETISRLATEAGAGLIITGLGRHRLVDRLLSDETALQIVRSASTPVLAVPGEFSRGPHTAIVGVDFSEMSIHAAQLALQMVSGAATVFLVNVAPRDDLYSLATNARAEYEDHAMTKLHELAARLQPPKTVHLQPVVRRGDPGAELLSYAADAGSELLAIGTRGLGFVSRMLVGSVASKVIRASTTPVLTVPA